jgi:hypothetical protein
MLDQTILNLLRWVEHDLRTLAAAGGGASCVTLAESITRLIRTTTARKRHAEEDYDELIPLMKRVKAARIYPDTVYWYLMWEAVVWKVAANVEDALLEMGFDSQLQELEAQYGPKVLGLPFNKEGLPQEAIDTHERIMTESCTVTREAEGSTLKHYAEREMANLCMANRADFQRRLECGRTQFFDGR